jgi:hypothetical protein
MTKHYQQGSQSEWRVHSELSRREMESLKEFTSKTIRQFSEQLSGKAPINPDIFMNQYSKPTNNEIDEVFTRTENILI